MRIEPLSPNGELRALLERCGLPIADLAASASLQCYGVQRDGRLLGVVALESYDAVALLRSLAVAPEARGSGLGQALVRFAEREAAARHIGRLYLLTNTAAPFFAKLGYQATARETAPPAIRMSAQFSGLCPASASFLSKRLDD